MLLHDAGLLTFSRHCASSGYQLLSPTIGLLPYGSCGHLVATVFFPTCPVDRSHVRTVNQPVGGFFRTWISYFTVQ